MTRARDDARRWVREGTDLVWRALSGLGADDRVLEAPSGLPGWSRKYLLSHVAANAAALGNLVAWARTGVVTPMYASPEQRTADIEAGASLPAADLVQRFERTAGELDEAWARLTDAQWSAEVVTAQGRTVPASETPWMRAREVMVHAVDLDTGVTFADLPGDFCAALVTDIARKRSAGGNPALEIVPTDAAGRWRVRGDGDPVTVSGPLANLTAWLAGRPFHEVSTTDGGPLPLLPAWL